MSMESAVYRVLRIDEQLYGCEELPEGQPVLCDVLLEDAEGSRRVLAYPDAELTRLNINEGDSVTLTGHTLARAQHRVYFTRHGETVWNVENKICGMTDSPLTEKGRAQARELGEKLRDSGLQIDEILYSPLSRAADTAKAIADATGWPARCEPRLREQCFGRYEGTPRDGEEFRISKTHFADRYTGGESMMQLAQRIYNLLDELRADRDHTYLLVAHNGIARVVQSYFRDMTNEEYAAAGIRNCEFVEFDFDE